MSTPPFSAAAPQSATVIIFPPLPPAPVSLPREGPPAMSPRARRRASELGVPLNALPLPAQGRRITEADVLAAAEKFKANNGQPPVLNKLRGRGVLIQPNQPLRLPAERVPLNPAAQLAAAQWTYSQQSIPQLRLEAVVRAEPLLTAVKRAAVESETDAPHAGDYIARAVGLALAEPEFRLFTAVLDGADLVYRGQIDVAVVLPGCAKPLLLAGADQRSLCDLGQLRRALSGSQQGLISKSEETQGALFTLCLVEGASVCDELVHPGQSGTLTLGDTALRPVRLPTGEPAIAPTWRLNLRVDRRLIGPELAARFLAKISGFIECPERLIC